VPDFHDVYEGDGGNAVPSPLPGIIETAGHLALFAATLGEPVSRKINDLFRGNDAALGCMLDGIASERADTASTILGRAFIDALLQDQRVDSAAKVLPYSPGYCGWHVSGQRELFAYLDPGQIDIELNASCLMSPIKSVSGVLIAGPAESHTFDNDFDFCLDCATWQCRERIASTTHRQPTTS
jgi:cobalamin-dependent methionine synthase I